MAARKKSAKRKAATAPKGKKRSSVKGSTSRASTPAPKRTSPRGRSRSTVGPALGLVVIGLVGLGVVGALALGQSGEPASTDPAPRPEVETVDVLAPGSSAPVVPVAYDLRVVARHPHDSSAFTQGLLWHDGALYESTGLVGRSSIRRWDLESGRIDRREEVPDVFAEGLALVGDELFQLTWQDGLLLVYDRETFEKVRQVRYEGEGWGLCYDGEHLVMSDGSDELTFRDPQSFAVRRRLSVRKLGRPLRMLNELECARGAIWANVWQRDDIVRIDPASGQVTGVVDAAGLLEVGDRRSADVLNGIAWLPDRERFLLTGKFWPAAFEVELVER